MARDNFARALAKVLVHEGGFADHPADPGGRTLQGITQATYDAYRRRIGRPARVLTPTLATDPGWKREREEIYREQYWDVIRGDNLPAGVDYVVFDGAVNSGPIQSAKWLQRALRPLYVGRIDGQIGAQTLAALQAHPNHDALIDSICDRRLAFLEQLRGFATFGRGWTRRVRDVRAVGQAWATGETVPQISYAMGGDAKALITDARSAPVLAPADLSTGAGGAGAAVGTTVLAAKESLMPLAGSNPTIDRIIVALTVGSVLLTIGGLVWREIARRRTAQRSDALDLSETAPA